MKVFGNWVVDAFFSSTLHKQLWVWWCPFRAGRSASIKNACAGEDTTVWQSSIWEKISKQSAQAVINSKTSWKCAIFFIIIKLSLLLGEEEMCVLKAYPHSVWLKKLPCRSSRGKRGETRSDAEAVPDGEALAYLSTYSIATPVKNLHGEREELRKRTFWRKV